MAELVAGELVELVAGHQQRDAALAREAAHEVAHLDDAHRVEAIGGLVEDQEFRVGDQGDGQGEALLHAEGEVPGRLAARVREADHLENPPRRRLVAHAGDDALDFEVLDRRHVREDRRRLDRLAGAPPALLQRRRTGAAEQFDVAAGLEYQAGDDAHEGGLAGAVEADQAIDLTAPDIDIDVLDRERARVALA